MEIYFSKGHLSELNNKGSNKILQQFNEELEAFESIGRRVVEWRIVVLHE